jgi:hypothetical protein
MPVLLAVALVTAAGLAIAAAYDDDQQQDNPYAAAAVAESVEEHTFHLSR